MDELADDLQAESADLDDVIAGVDDLTVPTPAPGWTVADQISHLWYFDRTAMLALDDPEAFRASTAELMERGTDVSTDFGRSVGRDELVAAWQHERRRLVDVARTLEPSTRVPWYGPSMGARSFITARLMETWAHGQDIADAVSVTRPATDRLRHVAHIGVTARPFAFHTHDRPDPGGDVHVALAAPSGATWTWGDDGAADRISGPALDFCLVVTQRRHLDDVALAVQGETATAWMDVAQAFAGAPGAKRYAGQFR